MKRKKHLKVVKGKQKQLTNAQRLEQIEARISHLELRTHKSLIAACMMLRANEPLLEEALQSIRDEVDIIAVIYTGDVKMIDMGIVDGKAKTGWRLDMDVSERDRDILLKYHCAVRKSPWNWDFSQHRNEAFLLATHIGAAWGLVIDADEVLSVPARGLKEIVTRPEFNASYMFNLRNVMPDNRLTSAWQTRLVSLHTRPYYNQRIHNKLSTPGYFFSPHVGNAIVYHRGYSLPTDQWTYKLNHRLTLIEQIIEEITRDPIRMKDPRQQNEVTELHFYRASILYKAAEFERTLEDLLYYEEHLGPTPDELSLKANVYRRQEKPIQSMETFEEIMKLSPKMIDAYYHAAVFAMSVLDKDGKPHSIEKAEKYTNEHTRLCKEWHDEPAAYPCVQELFTVEDSPKLQEMLKCVKDAIREGRKIEWEKIEVKVDDLISTLSTPGTKPKLKGSKAEYVNMEEGE